MFPAQVSWRVLFADLMEDPEGVSGAGDVVLVSGRADVK